MSITDDQIEREIEGRLQIKIHVSDTYPTHISLYDQEGGLFIKPAFCVAKQLPRSLYAELCNQFTGEQEFNTDPEVIRTELTFDQFFDLYYNNL